jgi:hypothetical protein
MNERSPFADWPYLDRPPRDHEPPSRAEEENEKDMASKNSLETFLGGPPLTVFVKLLFVSLVVGALLMWLELRPIDLLRGVQRFIDRISSLGFDAVRIVVEYVAAGAVIVVPIWFVLRLFNASGRR